MGILNVTPDSFADGGKFAAVDQAVGHARDMIEAGADFIDIGGESTRPGSDAIDAEEELRRILPVIERLTAIADVPISVDTYKYAVAEAAIKAGATIVNDITAMTFDVRMAELIAQHGASVVLMHMKGTPKTMQENPTYVDVTEEVAQFLALQARNAQAAGIEQIIIDPGIGFGKKLEHNLDLLRNLQKLRALGYPVLVGPSRKSFIGTILDLPVSERLEGTAAAVAVSILNGANIVRVHDVKEIKRVAKIIDAVRQ